MPTTSQLRDVPCAGCHPRVAVPLLLALAAGGCGGAGTEPGSRAGALPAPLQGRYVLSLSSDSQDCTGLFVAPVNTMVTTPVAITADAASWLVRATGPDDDLTLQLNAGNVDVTGIAVDGVIGGTAADTSTSPIGGTVAIHGPDESAAPTAGEMAPNAWITTGTSTAAIAYANRTGQVASCTVVHWDLIHR